MKRLILGTIITLLVLTFIGCTHFKPKNTEAVEEPLSTDASLEAIKQGTERIHQELVKLAKYQQQKDHKAIARVQTYETPTKGPLSKRIDLTWTGPIDKMVAKLAEEAGYEFPIPLGIPHFRETIVQVDVIDTPIFNVIEDVGWQASDRIAVILDQNRKKISLAYKGD